MWRCWGCPSLACGAGKGLPVLPNFTFLNTMQLVFELLELALWCLPKIAPAGLGFPRGMAEEARLGLGGHAEIPAWPL